MIYEFSNLLKYSVLRLFKGHFNAFSHLAVLSGLLGKSKLIFEDTFKKNSNELFKQLVQFKKKPRKQLMIHEFPNLLEYTALSTFQVISANFYI